MSGRCKDCKHWGALPILDKHYDGQHRRCSEVSVSGGTEGKAYVISSEDMHDLMTAPDFGCVLFEAKEET